MTNKYTQHDKEKLVKIMGELIEPHIPAFSDAFQRFGQWLQDVHTRYLPLMETLVKVDWEQVQKRLKDMPKRSRIAMSIAADQGWFFNWQDSLQNTLRLIDGISAARDGEIDAILEDYYEENIEWYTLKLCEIYPARKTVIQAAINAHQTGTSDGYCLSVPVFLAQADGLFWEISGIESPMNKVRGGDSLVGSAWIKSKIGDDQRANDLLSPFFQMHNSDLLISQSARQKKYTDRGKVFNALNRHQVLHGEVSDYGTRINSLKAFSLVIFIGLHLPDILEMKHSEQNDAI